MREYSLNFPNLSATPTAGAMNPASGQQLNEATQKLRDIFKRRK